MVTAQLRRGVRVDPVRRSRDRKRALSHSCCAGGGGGQPQPMNEAADWAWWLPRSHARNVQLFAIPCVSHSIWSQFQWSRLQALQARWSPGGLRPAMGTGWPGGAQRLPGPSPAGGNVGALERGRILSLQFAHRLLLGLNQAGESVVHFARGERGPIGVGPRKSPARARELLSTASRLLHWPDRPKKKGGRSSRCASCRPRDQEERGGLACDP